METTMKKESSFYYECFADELEKISNFRNAQIGAAIGGIGGIAASLSHAKFIRNPSIRKTLKEGFDSDNLYEFYSLPDAIKEELSKYPIGPDIAIGGSLGAGIGAGIGALIGNKPKTISGRIANAIRDERTRNALILSGGAAGAVGAGAGLSNLMRRE